MDRSAPTLWLGTGRLIRIALHPLTVRKQILTSPRPFLSALLAAEPLTLAERSSRLARICGDDAARRLPRVGHRVGWQRPGLLVQPVDLDEQGRNLLYLIDVHLVRPVGARCLDFLATTIRVGWRMWKYRQAGSTTYITMTT